MIYASFGVGEGGTTSLPRIIINLPRNYSRTVLIQRLARSFGTDRQTHKDPVTFMHVVILVYCICMTRVWRASISYLKLEKKLFKSRKTNDIEITIIFAHIFARMFKFFFLFQSRAFLDHGCVPNTLLFASDILELSLFI